jgi:phage gp36-like protein
MAYNTKQNMIDRYGEEELIQLTDRTRDGVINDAVLNQAINDAAAEIDGYLAGRYQLPLAVTPPILIVYACDMTRYRLYADAATEQVDKRYQDAVKFLRFAADGKVQLGPTADGSKPTPAGGAQMESGGRIWGRGTSGDFI